MYDRYLCSRCEYLLRHTSSFSFFLPFISNDHFLSIRCDYRLRYISLVHFIYTLIPVQFIIDVKTWLSSSHTACLMIKTQLTGFCPACVPKRHILLWIQKVVRGNPQHPVLIWSTVSFINQFLARDKLSKWLASSIPVLLAASILSCF